jgi:tRNA-dihydrouridine synthase B
MLSIGDITIPSSLVLAPMAGISDQPYRLVNRAFGCEFAFTEMISATALAYRSRRTLEKLSALPEDRPLGIQIVGADPEIIKRALDVIHKYSFDSIDLNAACPVRKVASRGKGAGLLLDPLKLQKLLRILVDNTSLPVTVKIRSGWDEGSVNAVEVALHAQDAGIQGLTIHGRTRDQRYRGKVDYNIIRKVKEALTIPLIASGDALTPELVRQMFDETGCDGVALARGALGNPWIFPQTIALLQNGPVLPAPDIHEKIRVIREHLAATIDLYGEKLGVILFRKFMAWYTKGLPIKELRGKAFGARTGDEMFQLIGRVQAHIAA